MATQDERLAKATRAAAGAMCPHPFYRGKTQVVPTCVVRDFCDWPHIHTGVRFVLVSLLGYNVIVSKVKFHN